jgi:pyrroline-5-carboxylate reductase
MNMIGFIGAGNMAKAIIGGLIANGFKPNTIHVSDPSAEKLQTLAQEYGVQTHSENKIVIQAADTVLFAVKPQILLSVATELKPIIQEKKPLLISIAAGISIAKLSACIGKGIAIVRCMPNTPAMVRQGMSGLYANEAVTPAQRQQTEKILRAVGHALWVKTEDEINQFTALSGSGPAYFFYFMEALQAAGEKMGLDPDTAKLLSLQTAYGAITLANQSYMPLAQLRANVTSPGGTTEKAIQVLEKREMKKIIGEAVEAALVRARELAD